MARHFVTISFICIGICFGIVTDAWAQKVGAIFVAIKGPAAKSVKTNKSEISRGEILTFREVDGSKFLVTYLNGNEVSRGSISRSDVIPFADAINFFTDDIQRKPTAENYCIRGTIWRLKREYDIAIGDYNDGIRLDAHYQPNFSGRAEAWIAKRQFDKAAADYNEAIRLNPRDPRAYFGRGYARECMFDDDHAIHDFSVAAQLDPHDYAAFHHRAYVYMHKHDNTSAIFDFTQAIAVKPNGDSYFQRGCLFLQNKAYDRALADFDAVIRIDPKFAFAYRLSASIRATCSDAKLRDGKKAIKDATKACELTDWKDSEYLDVLAAACAEAGDFDAAIKWEQKAMDGPSADRPTYEKRLDTYKDHKTLRLE